MLVGTLKETLIFEKNDDKGASYRYEIYKNEQKSGYFAVIYQQKSIVLNNQSLLVWAIAESHWRLKAGYIPNARMECQSHWKVTFQHQPA
ncbi:hypothetical protein FJU30_08015 [Affinibrenneria salicis]|uniref:Uncharacterized protein n=1 Tax=Affinibrenneria salicis TaxID=2590031 RepID=A0A5J5G3D8_9GAMM|nr:hypothetical protein [Affinibrenneria salicis]KAA9001181.1 hypothetical protein FJU30_08015 [Affinibrenneria salicis]